MITLQQLHTALQAAYDRPGRKKFPSWLSPASIEDDKAIRRIQNDRDLLQIIVDKLNEKSPKSEFRAPKSGPWIVKRNNKYVTSARFSLDDYPIPDRIVMVNARGGAHGFSWGDAAALLNRLGKDAELENIE